MLSRTIILAGLRRDLSVEYHDFKTKPATQNLRYWTSSFPPLSKHPSVTVFLVHSFDTLLLKMTIKQFWMRSLDFPSINAFLLFFGLNYSMSFVFNTVSCCDLSDIIRDGPWMKETYYVAGLAFRTWHFLALRIMKGNWDWRDMS